jgi:hypothetical protein
MNLSEVTIGTKLTRLDQRVIDLLIERDICNRELLLSPRLQTKPSKPTSFTEEAEFNKYAIRYSDYDPRITPYYTRAIEPVDHYLIPRMNELGYTVVVTHHPQFKHVTVYNNTNAEVATVSHEKRTVAISTACLLAHKSPKEDDFSFISNTIKK